MPYLSRGKIFYLMKNNYSIFPLILGIFLFFASGCKKEDESTNLTITDVDGNIYKTVTIGNQVWMAENLKTTHYNDGIAIPKITDNDEWVTSTSGAYCWYNNDETTYKKTYGALYNWYTVENEKICPSGWHVPTDAEWTELEEYLIANGYNYDGTVSGNKIGKSLASKTNWNNSSEIGTIGNDQQSNNLTGFTVLPSGYRNNLFSGLGTASGFWSATEYDNSSAYVRGLFYNLIYIEHFHGDNKYEGLSVRCIKNN